MMKKTFLLSVLSALLFSVTPPVFAEVIEKAEENSFSFETCADSSDIRGFWKRLYKNGNTQCIVAIYEYKGVRYGRIIASCNKEGVINDSIYHPKDHAIGVVGEPFYCGLDFIFDLRPKGSRFKGNIVDPQKGKIYRAELWVNEGNLIVRGELFIFGRNEVWYRAQDSDFTSKFKKPDTSRFIPSIPEVK